MKRFLSAMLASASLILVYAAPAQAAPLNAATHFSLDKPSTIKVHGYHRSCRWGAGRGRWHRHVGDGRPVGCGRRVHGYYGYVGPRVHLEFGRAPRFHRHHRRLH